MASIRFYLNPLKTSSNAQIIAAFQDGSKCPTKYTGYTIPSTKTGGSYKHWNKKDQRVKGLLNSDEINKKLLDWESKFENYITSCNLTSDFPDIPAFIQSLTGVIHTSAKSVHAKAPTLLSLLTSFRASIKTTHEPITRRSYKVLEGNIEEYEKKRGKTILLTDIGRAFFNDFTRYLIDEENNFNSTVNRKCGQIIAVVNYAVTELRIKLPDTEYSNCKRLKIVKSAKFPLYPEELATLHAHTPAAPYHKIVLDAFLLACETGLRYSDIQQLQPAHVKSHIAPTGIIRFIDLTNIKTDNTNNMPLSDKACAIIDQYLPGGAAHDPAGKKLFRFDYSQSASRCLKAIFEKVELTRPCEVIHMQGSKTVREMKPLHDIISFHMGRNTYITRLLSSNVAPVFVQGNAGHSDLKVTMGYFRNDDITRWTATLAALNTPIPGPSKN